MINAPISTPCIKRLPIPPNGLTRILAGIAPEITIGDMRAAANQLTIPFEMVVSYVHGQSFDLETTTDLIAFFQRRLDLKKQVSHE